MRTAITILLMALLIGEARAQLVYEKDVAPVLRTYCAGCHNDEQKENGFSVETYAALRKGGEDKGDPIKPGDAANSILIKSIEKRARPHMPPKDEPQVPTAELDLLKKWIASGAQAPKKDESILQSLVVPKIASAGGASPVTAIAWAPDGKQIAVALAGRIELRGSPQGKARRTLTGIPGKINALHFSPDGARLIAAGGITGLNGIAKIWDLKTGEVVAEFSGHRDTLYDAEFSPNGKWVATAGYDRVIRIWQANDAKLARSIAVHNGAIFDLAFDPTGAVLASASADQTVKLWRVSDGTRLDTLNQPQGELNAVTFTPDGQHILAAGADKRIHMWKFVSRDAPALNPVIHSRFAHEAPITAISLTADGKQLITTASDRTLKVWSVPDLTEQFAYEIQPDVTAALAAAPRKEQFLAARMDGSLETYPIKAISKKSSAPSKIQTPNAVAEFSTNILKLAEIEPNDSVARAMAATLPSEIKGTIEKPGDVDLFRFTAKAGEELTFAIDAVQSKSPLDSRVEILNANGQPVEQVVLQAVRDSWFTFRGKDSDTSGDFRLQNWAEMELNEFLFANGEVTKLWLYPRGPDSGFLVYPGEGKRHAFFGTTPISHALNEPCYIVTPFPPGSQPAPNGLPIFRLNYENDDDPSRLSGTDSLLIFTAPANSEYIARVTDVRGFGGTNFHYTLTMRERRPDFSVALEGFNPQISLGSGREIRFVATRREGFDGPIYIDISGLPVGFSASSPIQIDAGQIEAVATIHADANAITPDTNAPTTVSINALAKIQGRDISHEAGKLGQIKLAKAPKVTVEILPGPDRSFVTESPGRPLEFIIRPGQTISARVRATRHDFKERIELGNEDSGRNLPHGIYVDNIGLNGLLIVEGETERDFFITASKVAKPGLRTFHLRAKGDGGQVSKPAILRVLPSSSTLAAASKAP